MIASLARKGAWEALDWFEIALNALPGAPKLPRRSKRTITRRVYERKPVQHIHYHNHIDRSPLIYRKETNAIQHKP